MTMARRSWWEGCGTADHRTSAVRKLEQTGEKAKYKTSYWGWRIERAEQLRALLVESPGSSPSSYKGDSQLSAASPRIGYPPQTSKGTRSTRGTQTGKILSYINKEI